MHRAFLAAIALLGCSTSLPHGADRGDPRLAWLVGTWRTSGSALFDDVEITAVVQPDGAIVLSERDTRSGRRSPELPGRLEVRDEEVVARLYDPAGAHAPAECRIVPIDNDAFRATNLPNAREGCGAPNPFFRVR